MGPLARPRSYRAENCQRATHVANLSLKALLSPKTGLLPVVQSLSKALGDGLAFEDAEGRLLWGTATDSTRTPVSDLGYVIGPSLPAAALAAFLEHTAAKEQERRALAGEVLHLYREVNLIEQLSQQLAALLDFASVGQAALDQARRLISASSGACFIREGDHLRGVASFGDPAVIGLPFAESILARGLADIAMDGDFTVIAAPLRSKGVIALAQTSAHAYTSADVKLLNTIAMQTAAAIENAMLCVEMVAAARDREHLAALQKELDTARTIQHSLVPRIFPPFPERADFDLHAQMTSAKAVGGDFFDFFLLDDHRLGLVIGDVSGKGIPAALYMAVTRTQIKTTALQGMAPDACLLAVNQVLVRDKVSSMFATCFYGILDTRTGQFDYCNAGHNPPYLLRLSGDVERVPITGGLPLGMFGKLKCVAGSVSLGSGEAIFLYTDGVPEATNAVLDDFTEDRMAASLQAAAGLAPSPLLDHVTRDLAEFTAGAPQSDDVTMLALRRNS